MKTVLTGVLILLAVSAPVAALSPTGSILARLGLGAVGGVAGAATAVAVIAEVAPLFESGIGSTAVVIGSLTVFGGLGGSLGVLAASSLFGIEGDVRGCLLGGLAGGLASGFTEPIAYTLGIRPAVAEFLGFAMLPVLPAVGATIGHAR